MRLLLLVVLLALAGCSSGPPCPPQFKRFTHPTFSVCYPWSWRIQSVVKKSERPPSHAPWLEFLVIGGDSYFTVDVMPVNPTDFPPTMPDRERAIERYALETGFVSRLRRSMRLHERLGSSEDILNGWSVRNRILQGYMGGPSVYEAGKIYEMPTPVTIGVTTGVVDDQVLLLTQVVPATLRVAVDTKTQTLDVFKQIRHTLTVNTQKAVPR